MAKTLRRLSMLVAAFNRVTFVGPIGAEVVGEIENLHVRKNPSRSVFANAGPRFGQRFSGQQPTIEHNEFLARECAHAILQLLDTGWL